jgi:hypothetical protein
MGKCALFCKRGKQRASRIIPQKASTTSDGATSELRQGGERLHDLPNDWIQAKMTMGRQRHGRRSVPPGETSSSAWWPNSLKLRAAFVAAWIGIANIVIPTEEPIPTTTANQSPQHRHHDGEHQEAFHDNLQVQIDLFMKVGEGKVSMIPFMDRPSQPVRFLL